MDVPVTQLPADDASRLSQLALDMREDSRSMDNRDKAGDWDKKTPDIVARDRSDREAMIATVERAALVLGLPDVLPPGDGLHCRVCKISRADRNLVAGVCIEHFEDGTIVAASKAALSDERRHALERAIFDALHCLTYSRDIDGAVQYLELAYGWKEDYRHKPDCRYFDHGPCTCKTTHPESEAVRERVARALARQDLRAQNFKHVNKFDEEQIELLVDELWGDWLDAADAAIAAGAAVLRTGTEAQASANDGDLPTRPVPFGEYGSSTLVNHGYGEFRTLSLAFDFPANWSDGEAYNWIVGACDREDGTPTAGEE